MDVPTEKQRKVITWIEWNLQTKGVKFTGTTKADAHKFISEYIEESKKARQEIRSRLAREKTDREIYNFIHREREKHRICAPRNDERQRKEEARRKRYEEFIEDLSWKYVDGSCEDFGGFYSDRMARKEVPYDEFCRHHDWG